MRKTVWHRSPILIAVLAVSILLTLPHVISNSYQQRVINVVLIYGIIALSQNLIVGITGQLDFGRAAFVGLGSYWSALTMMRLHFPFALSFITAGIFTFCIGWFLGVLCRKAYFDYLTLITIGFNIICQLVFRNWFSVTRGGFGIPRVPPPQFGPLLFDNDRKFYYMALVFLALTYAIIRRLVNSRIGRAFSAVKSDAIAARYCGIAVADYKVLSFALGSFFTGIAGSLYAHYNGFVGPSSYSIDESIIILQMVILGGVGSLPGSILGAAMLVILPEISRTFYQYRLVFVGLMMVVMMIWCPNGLLGKKGLLERITRRRRTPQGNKEGIAA